MNAHSAVILYAYTNVAMIAQLRASCLIMTAERCVCRQMFVLDTYANMHNRMLNHLLMCLSALDALLTVAAAAILGIKSLAGTSCTIKLLLPVSLSTVLHQVCFVPHHIPVCYVIMPRILAQVFGSLRSIKNLATCAGLCCWSVTVCSVAVRCSHYSHDCDVCGHVLQLHPVLIDSP